LGLAAPVGMNDGEAADRQDLIDEPADQRHSGPPLR
jgi:hypothetical protein